MTKVVAAVVMVAACGAAEHEQLDKSLFTNVSPAIEAAAADFARVASAGDANAIAGYFGDSVGYGGMWFSDPGCAAAFKSAGRIAGAQLPAFAKCVATLPLTMNSHRQFLDAMTFDYAPGFEIEATFDEHAPHGGAARLLWIGFRARRTADPVVSTDALEKLRDNGVARPEPDAAGKAKLDADLARYKLEVELATFDVCVDATGSLTAVVPRYATSPAALEVLSSELANWHFRPFVAGDAPVAACALGNLQYPTAGDPKRARLPPPVLGLSRTLFDSRVLGRHTAGDSVIVPDEPEKTLLASTGQSRVLSEILMCIDASGAVTDAATVKRSGLPQWDAAAVKAVRGWSYDPLVVDGKPIAGCANIDFVYTQW